MTDVRNPDGTMVHRLDGAAPLFDSKSGAEAIGKRWEVQEARNKRALITFAEAKLDLDVGEMEYEDALQAILLEPLFRKAAAEHVAGIKLALQLLGEMPDHVDAKVVTDARQVHYNVYNFESKTRAFDYIEDLENAGDQKTADAVRDQIIGDGPYEVKVEA